ncbi:DUF6471 domain-containing protein [Paraburkholderia youngii]|uniref:DUF6471 domain-containing protein n=1 Tax=Paraburkholderia youngii TaxID=2782701 RepID=UPI003D1BA5DA
MSDYLTVFKAARNNPPFALGSRGGMADWYQIAGNVLRAELARQGVTYRQLAAAMTRILYGIPS